MNVLVKDFLRELKDSWTRFLSILMIVALGCGFFAGIRAAGDDMKNTLNIYYQDTHFMDAQVTGSYGLTEEDIQAIGQLPDVGRVVPAYQADVLAADGELVLRVHSLGQGINEAQLLSGRMPERPGECVVEDPGENQITQGEGIIGLNQRLKLTTGLADVPIGEYLRQDEYTIVGTVRSPMYLSMNRPSSLIGSGTVDYYMMVPAQDFAMEVYASAWIAMEQPIFDTYSDAYRAGGARITGELERLAGSRESIRTEEVLREPRQEIEDGQRELDEARTSGEQELADARQRIAQGEEALETGRSRQAQGAVDLKAGTERGHRQLAESLKTLNEREKEYQSSQAAFQSGETAWNTAKGQLEQGIAQVQQQIDPLEQQRPQIDGLKAVLSVLQDVIANGDGYDPAQIAQAVSVVSAYDSGLGAVLQAYLTNVTGGTADPENEAVIGSALSSIQTNLGAWKGALDGLYQKKQELQAQLDGGQAEINAGRQGLQTFRAGLDEGWKQYDAGVSKLNQERAAGERQLQQALLDIETGEAALEEAKTQLADGERELEERLQQAQAELDDARRRLDGLKPASWTVESRDQMSEVTGYESNAHRIDSIANVFPVFFVLIAALVCLTTMTRMVEDERLQIGTLKAMGYSNFAIANKYLFYAFLASLIGSVVGLLVGFQVFPRVVFGAYSAMLYQMPAMQLDTHFALALLTALVAVLVTTLATFSVLVGVLRRPAAQLMRPAAPRAGKRILLERIRPIWDRLSFSYKVTARNVFRYKKRMLMSVIGIAGCTALMLAGFGVKDAIADIVPIQFNDIFHYDVNLVLDEQVSDYSELNFRLEQEGELTSHMFYRAENGSVQVGESQEAISFLVTNQPRELQQYITLNTPEGRPLELRDDGVILTQKLADAYDIRPGDEILLEREGELVPAKVTGVMENYVFHYVYMTDVFYRQQFGEEMAYNRAFGIFAGEDEEERVRQLSNRIMESDEVLTAILSTDIHQMMSEQMSSLDTVIFVLVFSAGLLAFIVMYNLTNINIIERQREIATLKVLGFTDQETDAYVFRENIILSVLGSLVGLVVGIFLTRFVTRSAEIDEVMFIQRIKWISYVFAFVLTMAFTLIVRFIMKFRLRKVDMIESLKSVE